MWYTDRSKMEQGLGPDPLVRTADFLQRWDQTYFAHLSDESICTIKTSRNIHTYADNQVMLDVLKANRFESSLVWSACGNAAAMINRVTHWVPRHFYIKGSKVADQLV